MNTMDASTVTRANLLLLEVNKPVIINYKERVWTLTRLGYTFFKLEHLGVQHTTLTALAVVKKLENGPQYVDHEVLWGGPHYYRG